MLPKDFDNPFSEEQKQEIENAKKLIPKLRAEIRRAQSAGIDMSRQLEELANLEKQINGIYGTYIQRRTTGTQ